MFKGISHLKTKASSANSLFSLTRRARSDRSDAMLMFGGLDDFEVTCLTLHPVCYPNHGPAIELSLASEALGLVRSLDWEIVQGPTKINKAVNKIANSDDSNSEGETD